MFQLFRGRNKAINDAKMSSAPNVQTMAAPEGKSPENEMNNPAISPRSEIPQPSKNRTEVRRASVYRANGRVYGGGALRRDRRHVMVALQLRVRSTVRGVS
jgi:hypothetical protein